MTKWGAFLFVKSLSLASQAPGLGEEAEERSREARDVTVLVVVVDLLLFWCFCTNFVASWSPTSFVAVSF